MKIQKAVVTPEWVEESAEKGECLPWGPFAALQEITQDLQKPWPPNRIGKIDEVAGIVPSSASASASSSKRSSGVLGGGGGGGGGKGQVKFTPRYDSSYACEKHCPLVCPNQGIVEQLHIIRKAREIEGDKRSALSYSRAIAVFISFIHFGMCL